MIENKRTSVSSTCFCGWYHTLIYKHKHAAGTITKSGVEPGFPVGEGGGPVWGGGVDLRCEHFSVKMYVKMKELVPVGRACAEIFCT